MHIMVSCKERQCRCDQDYDPVLGITRYGHNGHTLTITDKQRADGDDYPLITAFVEGMHKQADRNVLMRELAAYRISRA